MSIKDRLREIIDSQNMSIKAFAESMQIPLRTLHNYLSGEREPNVEFLINLSEKLNINLNWLLLDKGKTYITDNENSSLTMDESELLNQYREVNESGKRILKKTSQIIFDELR